MKTVAANRKARFEYEILDTLEAGMVLTGGEAKSCRMGHIDMSGAYVSVLRGIVTLKQCKIMPYKFASGADHIIGRDRTLLLNKKQIDNIHAAIAQKGIAVIPLEIKAGKYVKVLLGIGRGRKRHDKRAAIKDRETKRQAREEQ
jgi:SsrA-binding protein